MNCHAEEKTTLREQYRLYESRLSLSVKPPHSTRLSRCMTQRFALYRSMNQSVRHIVWTPLKLSKQNRKKIALPSFREEIWLPIARGENTYPLYFREDSGNKKEATGCYTWGKKEVRRYTKKERPTIRPDLKSETGIINEKVALMMLHLRFSLIQRHAADGMR